MNYASGNLYATEFIKMSYFDKYFVQLLILHTNKNIEEKFFSELKNLYQNCFQFAVMSSYLIPMHNKL